MKELSQQRRWQLKQQAAGDCTICRKKAAKGRLLCAAHLERNRERSKQYYQTNRAYHLRALKAWREANPEYMSKYYQKNIKPRR